MRVRERLVASITDIRTRGQRLVELNRELLAAEMKEKGRRFGAAAALFAGAGLLALYALGFALATIAVALALVLPLWLAMLIVTALLLLVITILVLVGRGLLRQAQESSTDTAAAEAKKTAALVKSQVRQTALTVRAGARGAGTTAGPPGTVSQPPSETGATER